MTHPSDEAPRPVDEPVDEPGSITLTQHILGLEPYLLLKAVELDEPDPNDPDDTGLRFVVEHNDDAGPALATLYVLMLPPEQNPITAAIKAVLESPLGDHSEARTVLTTFADFLGVPMPS